MADTDDGDAVECPLCGQPFDPTAAGGWCTNPDCGEWQYEGAAGDGDEASEDAAPAADSETGPTDELGTEAADADSADADPEAGPAEPDPASGEASWEDVDPAPEGTASAPEDEDDESDVDAADDHGDETPATDDADASEPAGAESASTSAETGPSDTDDTGADTDAVTADTPATIECPDCGTELDADANFCIECGADVQAVEPGGDDLTKCPSCGTDLEGDEHFCANCGEDLEAHRGGSGDAEADVDAVDALAAQSADETAAVPDSLVLSVAGTDITVADGDRVGRAVRAALADAGRPEDEAVRIHREHVRFVREADGFYLVDLGENPTTLNGRSLRKGDREPVGPGDELELSGVATITIEAP
ncbi:MULTISPECIES: zinc-ribbon domain-containing protein [Haloarcula]|uniref:zinc-ribbon domain-containing protein n=1 Tax=Haloarcula TaxID=2237 RepID=UPI0023EC9DDB|nr:zinc-ribbon domain-containing protein [Halomicroarcula sp. XH51]